MYTCHMIKVTMTTVKDAKVSCYYVPAVVSSQLWLSFLVPIYPGSRPEGSACSVALIILFIYTKECPICHEGFLQLHLDGQGNDNKCTGIDTINICSKYKTDVEFYWNTDHRQSIVSYTIQVYTINIS